MGKRKADGTGNKKKRQGEEDDLLLQKACANDDRPAEEDDGGSGTTAQPTGPETLASLPARESLFICEFGLPPGMPDGIKWSAGVRISMVIADTCTKPHEKSAAYATLFRFVILPIADGCIVILSRLELHVLVPTCLHGQFFSVSGLVMREPEKSAGALCDRISTDGIMSWLSGHGDFSSASLRAVCWSPPGLLPAQCSVLTVLFTDGDVMLFSVDARAGSVDTTTRSGSRITSTDLSPLPGFSGNYYSHKQRLPHVSCVCWIDLQHCQPVVNTCTWRRRALLAAAGERSITLWSTWAQPLTPSGHQVQWNMHWKVVIPKGEQQHKEGYCCAMEHCAWIDGPDQHLQHALAVALTDGELLTVLIPHDVCTNDCSATSPTIVSRGSVDEPPLFVRHSQGVVLVGTSLSLYIFSARPNTGNGAQASCMLLERAHVHQITAIDVEQPVAFSSLSNVQGGEENDDDDCDEDEEDNDNDDDEEQQQNGRQDPTQDHKFVTCTIDGTALHWLVTLRIDANANITITSCTSEALSSPFFSGLLGFTTSPDSCVQAYLEVMPASKRITREVQLKDQRHARIRLRLLPSAIAGTRWLQTKTAVLTILRDIAHREPHSLVGFVLGVCHAVEHGYTSPALLQHMNGALYTDRSQGEEGRFEAVIGVLRECAEACAQAQQPHVFREARKQWWASTVSMLAYNCVRWVVPRCMGWEANSNASVEGVLAQRWAWCCIKTFHDTFLNEQVSPYRAHVDECKSLRRCVALCSPAMEEEEVLRATTRYLEWFCTSEPTIDLERDECPVCSQNAVFSAFSPFQAMCDGPGQHRFERCLHTYLLIDGMRTPDGVDQCPSCGKFALHNVYKHVRERGSFGWLPFLGGVVLCPLCGMILSKRAL